MSSFQAQMGEFVESSDIFNEGNNRRFHVVLRVPAEHFSELKTHIEETGRSIQNVTGEYYDTQAGWR